MQVQNRTTILDPQIVPSFEPHASSIVSEPRRATVTTWREPMLRGVLAVVMGLVLVMLPITAAYVLAIAFGVYVLIDGVFTIIHAARNAHPDAGHWWTMLLRGILGVVVGAFAILFPSAAAAALGTLVAIWAIVAGVLEISAGFRVRHDAPREAMLFGLGALTIVLGAVLLFAPILAVVAQIYVFAAYAIVTGVGLITYALRLKRRAANARPRMDVTKNRGTLLPQ